MPVEPLPCGSGAGGDAGADVEQTLLCDILPDGEIAGTALAVYEYDSEGNPAGPPTFVDPATGNPYVAQGILQPCPGDVGCAPPTQFCFTSTSTGPVEHPGRIYDISLPINPGFAVDSLQIDATNYPANITWAVTDPDGEQFRPALQSFLDARFPGLTVTVTNPNAGNPVCGQAIPMTIHIECARIDAPAPNLVELIYNGGRDLVVNPAYLTTPPTNLNGPQFVYLQRQDAGGTLNCTSVANQGWETNDLGGNGTRDFELWGQGPGGLQTIQNTTPTPRGTPVQEITADINDTGTGPTIWQTFTVPAAGVFKAVMVHGARDNGEQHRITLSTGDTDDNQIGDIINNVTNPPQVTNAGGNQPGPWTSFSQDVALGAGTYTFALSTTNPVGANRGGLFTDMRVYVDAPDQHAAAVTDDETCTVTTEETVTTTTCEYWQPRCSNGEITHWVNVADGEELTNAAFWGQAPAPSCCLPEGGDGGGGSVSAGNLIHNYEVCGIVGGIAQTLQRVVITDQSGGVQAQTFVGADGGPVTPSSYTVGACDTGSPVVGEFILCDDNGPFVRKLIQSPTGLVTSVVNVTLAGVPYVPAGTVQECPECVPVVLGEVCVTSTDFPGVTLPATAVQACDGTVAYVNASTGEPWPNTTGVVVCPPDSTQWEEILCDAGNDGHQFRRVYNLTPLGSVVSYDEEFDTTAYAVVGPVERCCSNAATLLVCDLPTGDPDGAPTVTDSGQQFIPDTANADFIQRPGGGGALWTGGVINFGPDVSPGPGPITQIHRFVSATLQATPPSCTDGTVNVSASVQVLNQGPGAGCSGAGRFRLYRVSDGAVLASSTPLVNTPAGDSVTLTFNADVPAAELNTGNLAVWLDVETWQTGTCAPPDSKTWQASNFTAAYVYGQEDCETQFLRTVVTDCETGATLATVDTTLDGAPYVVAGDVGQCTPASKSEVCTSCQTLTLCDFGADVPVLITGISTGGTLSNGVTWSGARGSSVNFNPQHNNADGSWWGMPSFPNATVAPDTWFFDRPVDVEFSVVIAHSPATGSGAVNQVQVPIGSELISSAPDYSYDVATGIVTVDSSNTGDCTKVTNPTVANSARFVLRNATQLTLDFLGQRIAICGQFSNWRFGSIAVTPATTTFLRTICRDCNGAVTSITDTETDGSTPYGPIGPVGDCSTPTDEPQCFATQICVQPQGVDEFISNEANLTSTVAVPNVDPVWKWSNDPDAGPWFDMYDVGVFPGWITVDPGTTEGVANWVAPHPNSSPNTSGIPGEGPTIGPGNANWYARAQFTLPANADPASIRIAATVLNADQLGVEFRLNDGAWQPVNASHTAPPFSFPAQVIPGAQAGLNEVIVHVQETVFGSGAAGVKMHLIASYNLGDQQSWTQIVCDDGTVSYFTNAGEQTDALPEDWVIVPCGVTSEDAACGTASSIGTVCYTPPVAVQTLQDDWTGATSVLGGGSRVWTNSNFAGQGITVTETVTPDTGAALLGAGVRNTATSPATQHTAIDLGAPRTNVTVRMDFFGAVQGERLRNVSPAFAAVSGNGTAVLANTGVDGGPAGDGTIFLTFPGPVQNISWDYAPTGGGLSGQSFISFNTGNASNSAPAAVLRDCETGVTTFVDLATGTVLNPAAISIVDCPGDEAATPVDQQDVETLILCDSTPTRFLRAIKYDAETGAVLSVVNTALDGTTPFAPVGAVGICSTPVATDFDFLSTVLCDANGTQFIQRLTFNSATGAVTATTNTTLTGAAFAPVAPVSLCSNCCPAVIGNGCTNTGSGFYTAIRAANGTISLIDSVTGAAVAAVNVIPCPSDNTVRTLTAQARLVGDADAPWTPGADVAGTLTSVTMTVLSGTATLTDQNGTVTAGLPAGFTATWSAEDDNTLSGPTSIDAIGGSTVVHWTQR